MILEKLRNDNVINNHIFDNIDRNCFYKDQICLMPKEITQLLLNSTVFYSRTLDESGNPYIRQIIFIYELDKCVISFLTKKDSPEEKNLSKNPFFPLTTQIGSEPMLKNDFGLRIKAKADILDIKEEIIKIARNLLRKYSSHLVKPEVVELYYSDNDVVINAQILEIYQWNGSLTKNIICEHRI